LPHQLCDTPHAYEFNCFDAVIALGNGFLQVKRRPDDVLAPFLVPYTPTNGSFMILPRATARDAFTLAYPAWYRDVTEQVLPTSMQDARISLTAVLFRCYVLPQSTTDAAAREAVMAVLRANWLVEEIKFPKNFELVLCHEINLPQHWFATAHAGLLFPRQRGFTYIEKAGGSGPFLRLDLDDKRDLLTWYAGMFKGAEKLGYTHHFATFNDAKSEMIEPGKPPSGRNK
jgi:hypothetical protein